MKRNILLLFLLALLSLLSGYLMSKASWIGRVGISLLHQEYNLLKIWWQGAIAVFIIELLFFVLHNFIHRRLPVVPGRILHFVLLLAALGGLYLTYDDFTNDFSHHLLKWRFHLGFYLIWVGWMITCISFLFKKKHQPIAAATNSDKTGAADL